MSIVLTLTVPPDLAEALAAAAAEAESTLTEHALALIDYALEGRETELAGDVDAVPSPVERSIARGYAAGGYSAREIALLMQLPVAQVRRALR